MSFPGGQDRRSLELRLQEALRRIMRLEKMAKSASSSSSGSSTSSRIQSAVISDLDNHKAAPDPHPQYLTPAEGDLAYDAIGAADAAVTAHEAEPDPHPIYLTEDEANALYSGGGGFDEHEFDGGDSHSHFLFAADGGASVAEFTSGVADAGNSATAYETFTNTLMAIATYDADGDGIVDAAEALNDGTKSATAAAVADHLANNANPHGVTAAQAGADPTGTAATAVSDHEAEADPHPGYLTPAEGDAAYSPTGHNHDAAYDAIGTASSEVAAHDASIGNHDDVDITTTPPTDGQALVWDAASSLFAPGSVASGGGGTSQAIYTGDRLADVVLSATDDLEITGLDLSGYDYIEVHVIARGVAVSLSEALKVQFNSDIGTNYHSTYFQRHADDTEAGSGVDGFAKSAIRAAQITAASSDADSFGQMSFRVVAPGATDKHKALVGNGFTSLSITNEGHQQLTSFGGRWSSTAAITAIKVLGHADQLAAGSRMVVIGYKEVDVGGGSGTGRELLTADHDLYVATTGDDANDGLTASTPFATIQKAVDVASKNYDLQGFNITINVAAGTYAENVNLKSVEGHGEAIILGDVATPSNVIVQPASGDCFKTFGYDGVFGTWHLKGLKLVAGTSALHVKSGLIFLSNIDFGSAAYHLVADDRVEVVFKGNYSVTGGANVHIWCRYGGLVRLGGTGTITWGAVSFANYVWYASWLGNIHVASTVTNSGAPTGTKYLAEYNAVINGASYAAGSVAGSTATGGQAAG